MTEPVAAPGLAPAPSSAPPALRFDEVHDAAGETRPHWRRLERDLTAAVDLALRFTYEGVVTHGLSQARVLPRVTPTQAVHLAELTVEPRPDDRAEHLDFFGNRVVHLAVARPHSVLSVTATAEVDVVPAAPGPAADKPWDATRSPDPELVQFVVGSPLVGADGATAAYARESFPAGRPLREAVTELTERIHRDFGPGNTRLRNQA